MHHRRADHAALLGPGEAARRLGVTTRTVQRWLRMGRLPAVRVGSRLKVPVDALAGGPGEALVRRAAVAAHPRPIRRLLVANRGELVARIARTCRRLGITCLALVTDDQRETWWSRQADERVPLATTYLDGAAVVRAALDAGARRHPPRLRLPGRAGGLRRGRGRGRPHLGRASGGRRCAPSATRPRHGSAPRRPACRCWPATTARTSPTGGWPGRRRPSAGPS